MAPERRFQVKTINRIRKKVSDKPNTARKRKGNTSAEKINCIRESDPKYNTN